MTVKNKRSTLDVSALGNVAGKTHNPVEILKHQRAGTSKGRSGRVQIQGFFDPSFRTNLKMLAAKEETTMELLLHEALADLFRKHNMEMT